MIVVEHVIYEKDGGGIGWPKLMGIIIWNIWKCRNAEIFRMGTMPTLVKLEHLWSPARETIMAGGFFVGEGGFSKQISSS